MVFREGQIVEGGKGWREEWRWWLKKGGGGEGRWLLWLAVGCELLTAAGEGTDGERESWKEGGDGER